MKSKEVATVLAAPVIWTNRAARAEHNLVHLYVQRQRYLAIVLTWKEKSWLFSGNKQIGYEFVLSQNGPVTEQFPRDKALTLFEDHRRPTKGPIIGPFFYHLGKKIKNKQTWL